MLPLFFLTETIGCARPNHECVSRKKIFRTMLNQCNRKGRIPLDRPSHRPCVTLPTFGNHFTFLWLLRKMVAKSFHLMITSILKALATSSSYHVRTATKPSMYRFRTHWRSILWRYLIALTIPLVLPQERPQILVFAIVSPFLLYTLSDIGPSEAKTQSGVDYGTHSSTHPCTEATQENWKQFEG